MSRTRKITTMKLHTFDLAVGASAAKYLVQLIVSNGNRLMLCRAAAVACCSRLYMKWNWNSWHFHICSLQWKLTARCRGYALVWWWKIVFHHVFRISPLDFDQPKLSTWWDFTRRICRWEKKSQNCLKYRCHNHHHMNMSFPIFPLQHSQSEREFSVFIYSALAFFPTNFSLFHAAHCTPHHARQQMMTTIFNFTLHNFISKAHTTVCAALQFQQPKNTRKMSHFSPGLARVFPIFHQRRQLFRWWARGASLCDRDKLT